MPKYRGVEYSIVSRGESFQFDFRRDGQRKRGQANTQEGCQRKAEAEIDGLLGDAPAEPVTAKQFSAPSLKKVFDLVYAMEWKGQKSGHTAQINARKVMGILGEDTPINAIGNEQIDNLILAMKEQELTPATIVRKLAALSKALRFALRRGWITAMPDLNRKAAGKERARTRFLTHEEEACILQYLTEWRSAPPVERERGDNGQYRPKHNHHTADPENYNPDFIAFLIDTGLRLSEAINLDWADVDGEWVRIPKNKADYPRSVPQTQRVRDILARRPKSGQRVWWDMTVSRADYQWSLVRKAMGLEGDKDFVLHTCRHTFASRLAMAGNDIAVIKELGGWKTLSMVLRYAHLVPDAKLTAFKKLAEWQAQAKAG